MMLLKCCTQYASKFGKFSSGHRTGKGQFLSQFQRKAMPKNVQTTILLHSFHMLVRLCSRSFNLGSSSMWTEKLADIQAGFRKDRGTRDQIADIHWIVEKARELPPKSISALLTMASLWLCGSQQTVENSSRDGNTRPPYLPPEKSVCRSRNSS